MTGPELLSHSSRPTRGAISLLALAFMLAVRVPGGSAAASFRTLPSTNTLGFVPSSSSSGPTSMSRIMMTKEDEEEEEEKKGIDTTVMLNPDLDNANSTNMENHEEGPPGPLAYCCIPGCMSCGFRQCWTVCYFPESSCCAEATIRELGGRFDSTLFVEDGDDVVVNSTAAYEE